jgi:hypothetical protein
MDDLLRLLDRTNRSMDNHQRANRLDAGVLAHGGLRGFATCDFPNADSRQNRIMYDVYLY